MPDVINTQFMSADGQQHHLVVAQPFGAGGGVFYLYIDKVFCGQIVPGLDGPVPYITTPLLAGDDLSAIIDIIEL